LNYEAAFELQMKNENGKMENGKSPLLSTVQANSGWDRQECLSCPPRRIIRSDCQRVKQQSRAINERSAAGINNSATERLIVV
jgi:hypothetical protein